MRCYLVIIFCCVAIFVSNAQYFVTTTGTAVNSGLDEDSSWSWSYAVKVAKSGDTINIKKGDYGDLTLTLATSGVYWRGYNETPGDIKIADGPISKVEIDDLFEHLPLITKKSRTEERAFIISGKNITLENIGITNGWAGILNTDKGNGNIFRNIRISNMGKDSDTCNTLKDDAYSGFGIQNYAANVQLLSSIFINIGGEAVNFKGGSNKGIIKYNYVYSGNCLNPTDYGILVSGQGKESSNCEIVSNTMYREKGLAHGMHGINLKYKVTHTRIEDNRLTGTALQLSFPDCQFNTVKNNYITGHGTKSSEWHANINFYNGPSDNLLSNNYITNTWMAIAIVSNSEDSIGYGALSNSGGHRNTLENFVISDVYNVIYANVAVGGGSPTPDGGFVKADQWNLRNITVHNATSFLSGHIQLNNWTLSNIILDQVTNQLVLGANKYSTGALVNPIVSNCYYHGNQNSYYSSSDIQEIGDPKFINVEEFPTGFRLKPDSPLRNRGSAGKAVATGGNERNILQQKDVGAYQYVND